MSQDMLRYRIDLHVYLIKEKAVQPKSHYRDRNFPDRSIHTEEAQCKECNRLKVMVRSLSSFGWSASSLLQSRHHKPQLNLWVPKSTRSRVSFLCEYPSFGACRSSDPDMMPSCGSGSTVEGGRAPTGGFCCSCRQISQWRHIEIRCFRLRGFVYQ